MERKLAIYVVQMSSGDSWRVITELLCVEVSTAQWHCWTVAQAVVQVYGHLVSTARYERCLGSIQEQFRFGGHGWLGVAGAIDCTHVAVGKPDRAG